MNKRSLSILLVEDDIDLVDLMVEAFRERNPNLEITEVPNGPSALEQLGRAAFDVVILDYTLPGMNGIEVLQRIKAAGFDVPVIMVSGQKNETIVDEAMDAGARGYILKTRNYHEQLFLTLEKMMGHLTFHRSIKVDPEQTI